MENLGSLLRGVGLFVCIGGILLAVLLAFLARSAFGSRRKQQVDRDDPGVFRERGSERPRYDSDRIESSGGFGEAPSSSRRERDRDIADRRDDTGSGIGSRRERDDDDRLADFRRKRDQDDDRDDVRSRGGFGG